MLSLLKLTSMNKTTLTGKKFAAVGAPISHELGAKMVKDFQDKYPAHQEYFEIGSDIISQILSQPGCEGLRLYNGMDSEGNVSLVYVGVDRKGNPIVEYTVVGSEGRLSRVEALIGDQSFPDSPPSGPTWW
jgi:hypothetical protein